jgi:hypothetical protein
MERDTKGEDGDFFQDFFKCFPLKILVEIRSTLGCVGPAGMIRPTSEHPGRCFRCPQARMCGWLDG